MPGSTMCDWDSAAGSGQTFIRGWSSSLFGVGLTRSRPCISPEFTRIVSTHTHFSISGLLLLASWFHHVDPWLLLPHRLMPVIT